MIARELGPARVWFTDRRGGVSEGPYATLNLADHVADVSRRVDENRRILAARLAAAPGAVPANPEEWVWLRQVHGTTVLHADGPGAGSPPEADAAVTTSSRLPLVVLTADCAPIALASDDAVAVVHAGWPGLLGGVVEAAVGALRAVGSGSVRALVGPCIHPADYEFGPDLLARFVDRFGAQVAARTRTGSPALDIPKAVRAALGEAGVDDPDDVDVSTAASSEHFSHRRDGICGRQAVVAVLP